MARLLSLAEVCLKIKRSKPTVRQWVKDGLFPEGKADPSGTVCWDETVVKAWQTLHITGFFEKYVKAILPEKRRQPPETAGSRTDKME